MGLSVGEQQRLAHDYDAQRARVSGGYKRVLQNGKKLYKKLALSLLNFISRNFQKSLDISFILVYTYINGGGKNHRIRKEVKIMTLEETIKYAKDFNYDIIMVKNGKYVAGTWDEQKYAEKNGWEFVGTVAQLLNA